MINFEKQFDSILEKYTKIEKNLSNQENYDSNKLIKLNKEYAELTPIVEAINNFKQAIKIDPDEEGFYINLGNIYKKINDYDNAIKVFNKGLNFKPESSELFNQIGLLLGKAFQLQDDLLEITSTEKKMGKSLNSDVLLNKKTCN